MQFAPDSISRLSGFLHGGEAEGAIVGVSR